MISFVIPTLNELENVDSTVNKIKNNFIDQSNYEIIFVDDKSNDGTIEKIKSISQTQNNIKLIISDNRKGLGNALLLGQKNSNGDFIFFLDCDNSINSSDLKKLLQSKKNNTLVIGSRYIRDSKINGVNFIKVILSRILNLIVSKYLNISALDISHSCRIFPKAIIFETNNLKHPVFFWEHSLFSSKKGYDILEIPISFDERKSGKTKNSFFYLFKNIFFSVKSILLLKMKY